MAKRKAKKTTRRRRKMGALAMKANSNIVKLGAIALGYFMGDKINDTIMSATGGKIDGKIVAGAEAGLGALLLLSKGKPSMIKTIGGGVALGAGLKKLLKEFGIINGIGGYGNVPVVGRRRINGYGNVPVVGAYSSPGTLAGYSTEGTLASRNGSAVMAGIRPDQEKEKMISPVRAMAS